MKEKQFRGVTVGIPTLGRPINLQWAFAFKSLTGPINTHMNMQWVYGKPVAEARNIIMWHAIEQKHEFVFFLGDDVEVPPNILRQLIYRMEHDKTLGVAGGIYCSRSVPAAPLVFKGDGGGSYWDWKLGEYFEVTGLGMDATLIRTQAFIELSEKMGTKDVFKTLSNNDFDDMVAKAEEWTEDLYFCDQLRKHTDWRIFADSSQMCVHWDVKNGMAYNLPSNSLPYTQVRDIKNDKRKKAIDLGCGEPPHANLGGDYEVTRVDIREECEPTYRGDLRLLPFADKAFDLLFSSHVLEHFNRAEWKALLKEWCRLVADDGTVILVLPNIEWAAKQIAEGNVNQDVLNVLYGAQSNPYDFHYNGWTPQLLEAALREHGFKTFTWQHQGYNMVVQATRVEEAKKPVARKKRVKHSNHAK